METYYIVIVVVLFALAISDLVVGVSNDAVNFLNSAIGSKAAPKWLIFTMAALGVLIGATFSDGMMEVARKGIFHPDMFFFSEIMIIFIAVMITDIILLDTFNALGMPTSTTVSIVFELLGSAVAVSLVKISNNTDSILDLDKYINSEKALAIVIGILLSVFIAFSIGAIVQYITRLIFSFRYRNSIKYFGSLFGGVAIAAITYFILIKGIKGSSFANYELSNGITISKYVSSHTLQIILMSIVGWTIILQIFKWVFNIKILKLTVLVGTFALAMAFAGNDLVNFIGVPIAGFNSFMEWKAAGMPNVDTFSMSMLKGPVATPAYMLFIAGIVMIITLIASKKARSVVATTVNLSRQNEGDERFNSSLVARILVKHSIKFNKVLTRVIPESTISYFDKKFQPHDYYAEDEEPPAFDKLRASVNLVVASILIAIGTSMKLPLSTTYVTFMVAMGTSLADRAWDRESAVYRISGVFAVIGGWFLTALIAFAVSALVAWLITIGGMYVLFTLIAFAVFMIVRNSIRFKKTEKEKTDQEDVVINDKDTTDKVYEKCRKGVISSLLSANKIFSIGIEGFVNEDNTVLKEALKIKKDFDKTSKKLKNKVLKTITKLGEDFESGHHYVQVMHYQREVYFSTHFLIDPFYEYLINQHKPFSKKQAEELKEMVSYIDAYINFALHIVKENKFDNIDELLTKKEIIVDKLYNNEKHQIKRIKSKEVNTRNSVLYFNFNTETKNLLNHTINLVKSYRDFDSSMKEKTV